jgi:glycosyltransferase involved in cell wall biosynthesis
MPVFNDVEFIEKSIVSLLNQTEKRFILFISDDGSTDGSAAICKKYEAIDPRIIYYKQPKNLGISKNMEFLLKQADTPYFMWAADDDLWNPTFIEKHIYSLENNEKSIVSFNRYDTIDENDVVFLNDNFNYSSNFRIVQLLKLALFSDDIFGYGVFKTEKIKKVKFPIWWWPTKNTPFNNIYPSLIFYLNNGKYLHLDEVLFYKREKEIGNINYDITSGGKGVFEIVNYSIRRFYLVIYSTFQCLKSTTWWNALLIFPILLCKWFMLDTFILLKRVLIRKFKVLKSKLVSSCASL